MDGIVIPGYIFHKILDGRESSPLDFLGPGFSRNVNKALPLIADAQPDRRRFALAISLSIRPKSMPPVEERTNPSPSSARAACATMPGVIGVPVRAAPSSQIAARAAAASGN